MELARARRFTQSSNRADVVNRSRAARKTSMVAFVLNASNTNGFGEATLNGVVGREPTGEILR